MTTSKALMPQEKCDKKSLAACSPIPGARFKSWVVTLVIVAVYLASAYYSRGRFGIEKVLTGFAMPVGLAWLLLTASVLRNWFGGTGKVNCCLQFFAWFFLTLCSTAPLPDLMMRRLESQVTDEFDPQADQPLDTVVVFGGGTQMGPRRAEAAGAGDRVLYAAELYLQGKAKQLITTGDECCEHTREIWQKLGIPHDAITMLPGSNSFQEIESLKQMLKNSPQQRIGILSSAFHLPRVLRLAKSAGLEALIPLAASHQSGSQEYTPLDFIPTPHHLMRFSDVFKEGLARLVGR